MPSELREIHCGAHRHEARTDQRSGERVRCGNGQSEEGGENMQPCLWITAIAIPACQGSHGARVAQIMQPGRRNAGRDPEMQLPYELLESDTDGARIYRPPSLQSEQRCLRVCTAIEPCSTAGDLLAKERLELRAERHQSAFIELGLSNHEHAAIKIDILTDRTETIRASVRDVQITLIMAVILVVAVIFLFLRSVWPTIIPGIAAPVSIVGSFGVMYAFGYSLDNLSLMGL